MVHIVADITYKSLQPGILNFEILTLMREILEPKGTPACPGKLADRLVESGYWAA